ncbi:MAG: PEP-CTERM sorting domain-containing protein [Candidatus Korobacteraceae bacterium]
MKIVRIFVLVACVALVATMANATVILGGTNDTYIAQALQTLNVQYTDDSGGFVNPAGLGSGDTIIMSFDGGGDGAFDYTNFLNAGGHLIMMGGSNYDPYRAFVGNYFNITNTQNGWYQDGAWHKDGNYQQTQYMPSDYTFNNSAMTYHMLTFLPTQNTLLLGHDDEPADIAAFRTYDNGGFFYYMAFDPGPYSSDPGDFNNWTVPFIQSALDAQVPEPSTLLMMGSSLLGLGIWRRRK